MNLPFVIPGHYEYLHSGSESKQIIRVLGEGDKKNYFKLSDGRELAETEILDNYIYLNTVSSENAPNNQINLGSISEEFEEYNEPEPETPKEVFVYTPPVKNNLITIPETYQPRTYTKNSDVEKLSIPIKSEEDIFIDTILEKLSAETAVKNYGEVQFKTTFEIPIQFNFKYDLQKLKQILQIFGTDNIDSKKFIERILLNDNENIKDKISSSIMKFLTEPDKIPEPIPQSITESQVITESHISVNANTGTVSKYSKILNNF